MARHRSIGPMFRYVSDVHKRTTRQTCKKDIYIPSKARLNVFRNTLRYSGAHILNNLPAKVKNVSSVEIFKIRILVNCILVNVVHVL